MSNPVRRPSPRTLDAGRSPPFATTKVDGADNVYVFRYGNAQSMFVVTSAGVIATDPIGYGRPQAVGAGPDTRPRCRSFCDAIVGSGAAAPEPRYALALQ